MALAPFTTADEVRGVLGVAPEELLDATLELNIYSINLKLALSKVDATVVSQFNTVNGISDASRTAVQTRFHEAVTIYAPYAVAVQVLPSLPMLAPKSITDGKAAVSKFSESPFKAMTAAIMQDHDRYLENLLEAFLGLTGVALTVLEAPVLFKGVSSSTDRVTNLAR